MCKLTLAAKQNVNERTSCVASIVNVALYPYPDSTDLYMSDMTTEVMPYKTQIRKPSMSADGGSRIPAITHKRCNDWYMISAVKY